MELEELQAYMDNPPEEMAQVVFMYRQAIGVRQQAQRHLAEARAKVVAAQQTAQQAVASLNKAMGVEEGLHGAVVALACPDGDKFIHLPTGTDGAPPDPDQE